MAGLQPHRVRRRPTDVELTATSETIDNIGDAMPVDKFGFKPTPTPRTFGEVSNSGIYQEAEK